jgi:hypothetical protein
MFSEVFEERLRHWRSLREKLQYSDSPLEDVLHAYSLAPRIHDKSVDMWDQKTWPGPWQLVDKNGYTDTCIICGICYTLQLTERFSNSQFEIHISTDNETKETFMLLAVDEEVINPMLGKVFNRTDVPASWISQKVYPMSDAH